MDGPAQKAPRYYSLCYGDLGTGQDMAKDVCVCEWTKLVSKQGNNQADWLGSVLKGWMEWDEDFVVSSE